MIHLQVWKQVLGDYFRSNYQFESFYEFGLCTLSYILQLASKLQGPSKQLLDDMGVPCYCKTSGSTGLHIYIPLGNKYTYEQSKEFARIIVKMVNDGLPKITTIERQIAERKDVSRLSLKQASCYDCIGLFSKT